MNNSRIKSLDSLRGIACLIVLIAHIISTSSAFGVYASGCGKIGVWCFMVLSGFLTFLPYALGKEVAVENIVQYVISYYRKKVIKLYPAYLIGLLFALLLGFINDFHSVVNHLMCVEGTGHFWYMPVVIKFYLIVPFMIILLGYLKEKLFVVLASILTIMLSIIFPFTAYIENAINLYWYLPVFLIGCLLSFVYVRTQSFNNKVFIMMLPVGVLIIILLTPKMRELLWNIEPTGWLQNKYIIFAILWSVVILGILQNEKLSNALAKCKFLQFMGKISYEVYLIHYLVMWKVIQYTNNFWGVAIIVIIVSILLAKTANYIINALLIKEKTR